MFIFKFVQVEMNVVIHVEIPALCELFEKVDVSGDGTISIEEYVSMCETYGIKVWLKIMDPLYLQFLIRNFIHRQ